MLMLFLEETFSKKALLALEIKIRDSVMQQIHEWETLGKRFHDALHSDYNINEIIILGEKVSQLSKLKYFKPLHLI